MTKRISVGQLLHCNPERVSGVRLQLNAGIDLLQDLEENCTVAHVVAWADLVLLIDPLQATMLKVGEDEVVQGRRDHQSGKERNVQQQLRASCGNQLFGGSKLVCSAEKTVEGGPNLRDYAVGLQLLKQRFGRSKFAFRRPDRVPAQRKYLSSVSFGRA